MNTVCDRDDCTGCNVCLNVCHRNAISIKDSITSLNACIEEDKCIGCKACYNVCPNIKHPDFKKPIFFYQGYANGTLREAGSSGSIATAIEQAFLRDGGYVFSCTFESGSFRYVLASDESEATLFSGSKYTKSSPGFVYQEIDALLRDNKKVLFLGLPCHVAALLNYVQSKDNLYCVDLICHGTPSSLLLVKYLREKKRNIHDIKNISFRNKTVFGLEIDGCKLLPKRVVDSYTNAFLYGIDYTENCYSCRYARTERVSDLTLGDYWGSAEEELKKGISLILCMSDKGGELLNRSHIWYEEADVDNALTHNHQLVHPTLRSSKRDYFLNAILKGKDFTTAYFKAMPKDAIKQSIKYFYFRHRQEIPDSIMGIDNEK